MDIDLATLCERLRGGEAEACSLAIEVPSFEAFHVIEKSLGDSFERLSVSTLLEEREPFLPTPGQLFLCLRTRRTEAAARKHRLIVLGLDAYLALLEVPFQNDCLRRVAAALHDDVGPNTACFVFRQAWQGLADAATNPLVRRRIRRVTRSGDAASGELVFAQLRFLLFPESPTFAKIPRCRSLTQWLERMAKWETLPDASKPIRLSFPMGQRKLPVFSPSRVTQCPTADSALAALQGWPEPRLSEPAAAFLLENDLGEKQPLAQAVLKHFHYKDNPLRTLRACQSEAERACLFWAFGHLDKQCPYLTAVRAEIGDTDTNVEGFIRHYVTVPEAVLKQRLDAETQKMAKERAQVITDFGVNDTLVRHTMDNFVEMHVRNLPTAVAAQWLGFNTEAEDVEWLRRTMLGERYTYDRSDLLRDYSADFPTDVPFAIRDYLDRYRVAKRANAVSEDFINEARDNAALRALEDQETRSACLVEWRNDPTAALLVVDALGAEYLPFLLSRIRTVGYTIDRAQVVRCNLPTDTAHNDLREEWGEARYRKVNDLDEALHIATERLDDASTPDVAIVAKTFVDNVRIVARVVTEGIRRAFKTKGISRVIVTGDHGTTRFATLAWQTCQGAIRTIDAETMAAAGLEPVNWRTARCTLKVRRDPAWVLSGDQTCASIRGYDRFSVRGGLGFESHGGATLEERAVPLLVVLNKMPVSCEATRSPARPARQIVEDSDFDI